MSSTTTSAQRARRGQMKKVMTVVDRIGLGLIYALVIAILPVTAVGFFSRTV